MADDRDEDRTTVVHTDSDRGGGGWIAVIVILLLVLLGLYMFRDEIFGAASTVDKVDVEVTTDGD